MIIQTKAKLEKLLLNLERSNVNKKYLFRGQEDSKFILQPSAFRPYEIDKSWSRYPVLKVEVKNTWIESVDLLNRFMAYLPNLPEKLTPLNYKNLAYFMAEGIVSLERVMWLQINLMRYQNDLFNSYYGRENYACEMDRKKLQEYPIDHWYNKETFAHGVSMQMVVLPQLTAIDNGKVLQGGHVFDGQASISECFPQHYGYGTRALDWTRNPYIALYFATKKFFSLKNQEERCFTIFQYQQIDTSGSALVKIKPANELIQNQRIVHQEGTFIYMTAANTFYLLHGRHPSLEDYIQNEPKIFDLYRCDIKATPEILQFIQEILTEKGLTGEFLEPKLSSEATIDD